MNTGNLTKTQQSRLRFWKKLNDVLKRRNTPFEPHEFNTKHYYHFSIGSSNLIAIELVNRENMIRIALYVKKELYKGLYDKREEIGKKLGEKLTWKRLKYQDTIFSYIYNFDLNNEDNHEALINSCIDKVLKVKAVFEPYIKALQK